MWNPTGRARGTLPFGSLGERPRNDSDLVDALSKGMLSFVIMILLYCEVNKREQGQRPYRLSSKW